MRRHGDLVDRGVLGKLLHMGFVLRNGEWTCVPSESEFQQHPLTVSCVELFLSHFSEIHGILYGTGLRRISGISKARWAVLLRWRCDDRSRYFIQHIVPHSTHKFSGDFEKHSCLLVYSFNHLEPNEDLVPRSVPG